MKRTDHSCPLIYLLAAILFGVKLAPVQVRETSLKIVFSWQNLLDVLFLHWLHLSSARRLVLCVSGPEKFSNDAKIQVQLKTRSYTQNFFGIFEKKNFQNANSGFFNVMYIFASQVFRSSSFPTCPQLSLNSLSTSSVKMQRQNCAGVVRSFRHFINYDACK